MATAIHWKKDDQFSHKINTNENPFKVVIQRVPSYTLNDINAYKPQKLVKNHKVTPDEGNRTKVQVTNSSYTSQPIPVDISERNFKESNQIYKRQWKKADDNVVDPLHPPPFKVDSKSIDEIDPRIRIRNKIQLSSKGIKILY